MITLAVASAFLTLASQLSDFTGGEDGLTFKVPELLSPGIQLPRSAVPRRHARRPVPHATTCCSSRRVALFLVMLRIVNSPFGRVLQAIRENEFRAEAIGYRTVVYRTAANVLSALFATLAGALLALWLRYNGPDTTLSFEIMIDILLIVVIGGMGTMYGAVVGSVALRAGAELPAGPDEARRRDALDGRAAAVGAAVARTAGCSGSACCSCCRSTTSRPASSGGLRAMRGRR